MDIWSLLTLIIVIIFGSIYGVAYRGLYYIISTDRPEWLKYKKGPSLLYVGMSKAGDPNVSLKIIYLAYSSKLKEINNQDANKYASMICFCLPLAVCFFCIFLALILS